MSRHGGTINTELTFIHFASSKAHKPDLDIQYYFNTSDIENNFQYHGEDFKTLGSRLRSMLRALNLEIQTMGTEFQDV